MQTFQGEKQKRWRIVKFTATVACQKHTWAGTVKQADLVSFNRFELNVLSVGLNFRIPPKKISQLRTQVPVWTYVPSTEGFYKKATSNLFLLSLALNLCQCPEALRPLILKFHFLLEKSAVVVLNFLDDILKRWLDRTVQHWTHRWTT